MFRHVLLPTDGSDLATAALDKGIDLAKALGARVTVLTVVERFHVVTLNPAQLEESIAKVSEDVPTITADLRQTVARASEVLARIDGMVADSAGPVHEFTQTGLPQFVRFTNEARALVASLEQLTARIERNPAGFFLGNQAPDYRR